MTKLGQRAEVQPVVTAPDGKKERAICARNRRLSFSLVVARWVSDFYGSNLRDGFKFRVYLYERLRKILTVFSDQVGRRVLDGGSGISAPPVRAATFRLPEPYNCFASKTGKFSRADTVSYQSQRIRVILKGNENTAKNPSLSARILLNPDSKESWIASGSCIT